MRKIPGLNCNRFRWHTRSGTSTRFYRANNWFSPAFLPFGKCWNSSPKRCLWQIFPPKFLHDALNKDPNHATLLSLKRKMIINPAHWGTLFPSFSSLVSSGDFDISLLIVLLQHLCGLSPPVNGWYAPPAATELTPAADIVRVRNLRNRVSHSALFSVDDANFRSYWSEIRNALVRLGGANYSAAIDQLKNAEHGPCCGGEPKGASPPMEDGWRC